MIKFVKGNILKSNTDAQVNPVNCVGVMGAGLALQFKTMYPDMFRVYSEACKNGKVHLGKLHIYKTDLVISPKFIFNFPTKQHWKDSSKIEDIKSGLVSLKKSLNCLPIKTIAIPPLGCGLGGLKWKDVKKEIVEALTDVTGVQIYVFEPNNQHDEP